MKNICCVEFHPGSKEERLPEFEPEFPYIASRVELNRQMGYVLPWHWHKSVELFYMEAGVLEYFTPGGTVVFPAGSGGIINSNVLHMTRLHESADRMVQLLHIFDPAMLAGSPGSRIERNYIMPIVAAPQIELIALFPEDETNQQLLAKIRDSFKLSSSEFGYEMKLSQQLSDIWLDLFALTQNRREHAGHYNSNNEKIKMMMIYIQDHFAEKISISDVAAAAYASERECYRVFKNCLHQTPQGYIREYRLQRACQMLAGSNDSITRIGHACGLGSSSYFGKVFLEVIGCTPGEYRTNWQNIDMKGQI